MLRSTQRDLMLDYYSPKYSGDAIEMALKELRLLAIKEGNEHSPEYINEYIDLCNLQELTEEAKNKNDGIVNDKTLYGLINLIKLYAYNIKLQTEELSDYMIGKHVSSYTKAEIKNSNTNADKIIDAVMKLETLIKGEIHEHNEVLERLNELQDQISDKEAEHKISHCTKDNSQSLFESVRIKAEKVKKLTAEANKEIAEMLQEANAI